ncbi:MAG: hypothetical protein AB7I38_14415 [Dehalococcoidia bacterium]
MSETTTETTAETTSTASTATEDQTLAEIQALATELGLTPGQIKGRLEASRKWEQRAKDNATAAEELDKLKAQSMSEQEKAVAAARDEGRKAATDELTDKLLRAEFKAAAAGKLPDGLVEAIDVKRFLTEDGEADTAAIAKFVEDNAQPESGTSTTSVPDFGQGNRGSAAGTASSDPLLADLISKL